MIQLSKHSIPAYLGFPKAFFLVPLLSPEGKRLPVKTVSYLPAMCSYGYWRKSVFHNTTQVSMMGKIAKILFFCGTSLIVKNLHSLF